MIYIIGGSGFIGSRLGKRFHYSNKLFRILDKRPSLGFPESFDLIDVRDINSISREIKSDSILINLAAEHRDDVRPMSLYDEVNVNGARNTCLIARENNVKKIIFTSSVAVYGFAPPNTDEDGQINPFNDYGRTKWEAEEIYKEWQAEDPENRVLVIIRPTVVFGEGNRGNVYNLLRQIASGKFLMFGSGNNKKSMAYVENVAAFIEYSLDFGPGLHIYNYIDKPDFTMNELIAKVRETIFNKKGVGLRLPSFLGLGIGYLADFVTAISGKSFPVSSIRVKKFLATTQFDTSTVKTGFSPPVSIEEGLKRTLQYEFIDDNSGNQTFDTE
ncbi:MAG: UDP-N-acetylglucosamine 4-epimerase [Gammaproteobacteria bacterium]|nr:UDP-N-acetylglucosamine 4-epimerase [Gammaproteobacteria bacterium]